MSLIYHIEMVRTATDSQTIENLYKRNVNEDIYKAERISIESDFQRGDEETGVWKEVSMIAYITSLLQKFPAGILTFVKDQSDVETQWCVLDGANRLRAMRDFINNKFCVHEKKYSELSPRVQAQFDNLHIPCQWVSIERSDPRDTIANMFSALNTHSVKLSSGEHAKAHGWKKNIPFIEIAKYFIMDVWTSSCNDNNMFPGFKTTIDEVREKWKYVFPKFGETRRCDSLAMFIGYLISAETSQFKYFDKRYPNIKDKLTEEPITRTSIENIVEKFENFIEIIINIEDKKMFKVVCGFPSRSIVAPIWKPICENSKFNNYNNRMSHFYNQLNTNIDLKARFSLINSGSNGETSNEKTNRLIEFIKQETIHMDDSEETY